MQDLTTGPATGVGVDYSGYTEAQLEAAAIDAGFEGLINNLLLEQLIDGILFPEEFNPAGDIVKKL